LLIEKVEEESLEENKLLEPTEKSTEALLEDRLQDLIM
jgi:hypothetical protein